MISFGDIILTTGSGAWLKTTPNPNPLNLPPFTIRVQYAPGTTPAIPVSHGATVTQVSADPNIWDVTQEHDENFYPYWGWLFATDLDLVAVLGANSSGITKMNHLFSGCENLRSVEYFDTSLCTSMETMFAHNLSLREIPWFDTHNVVTMRNMFDGATSFVHCPDLDTSRVTQMSGMFAYTAIQEAPALDTSSVEEMIDMFYVCESLKHVPLYSTASCIDMRSMFAFCPNVEGGALALYNQASSQAVPPTYYRGAFYECGKDTVSGAAELAQIPYDWRIPEGFEELWPQ